MLKSAVLFGSAVTASAKLSFMKGGDLCGGINVECSDIETCTTMAFGPCKDATAGPSVYFESHYVGLALVNESNYLDCADVHNCPAMKVINPANGTNGWRDFSSKNVVGDDEKATYAYAMTGQIFGSLETAGAYVGIAGYLSTGTSDITTNKNNFYVATKSDTSRTQRDDSNYGAPAGPYVACITKDCKKETVTYSPGSYKFSIFGYTSGDNYGESVQPGVDDNPANISHIGLRMKMKLVGATVKDAVVNGATAVSEAKNTDVTKLAVTTANGRSLTVDFPSNYNYGPTSSESTELTVSGSGNVKIHVSVVDDSSVYLDYLFDADHFMEADRYFVYDPTVTDVAPEASAASLPATALWAISLPFLAMLMH